MKTIIIIMIADDMLKHVSEPGCILCSVNQSSEHPASLTLPPVIVIIISKFIFSNYLTILIDVIERKTRGKSIICP